MKAMSKSHDSQPYSENVIRLAASTLQSNNLIVIWEENGEVHTASPLPTIHQIGLTEKALYQLLRSPHG